MAIGYSTTRTRAQLLLTRGYRTQAPQNAHAQCRLGIAANGLETVRMPSESNDQNVGYSTRVSTKPNVRPSPNTSSRRGGISGKRAKPIRPIVVMNASVLRHSG